ncbi:MAG: DUF898 family protein [Gammaproteobacteria bacterium]|nr:DUF898 family protein [Gammaproteobacteria bacterium]
MYDDTPPDTLRAPISDAAPATPVPAKPAGHRTIPLEFTGNAREYFGIWIVNVFLTLLTLGIYTAWAKVRTKRYFYNNTLFDRTPFDYLANPIAILKGWLIAMAVMVCYTVLTHFYPRAQLFCCATPRIAMCVLISAEPIVMPSVCSSAWVSGSE